MICGVGGVAVPWPVNGYGLVALRKAGNDGVKVVKRVESCVKEDDGSAGPVNLVGDVPNAS